MTVSAKAYQVLSCLKLFLVIFTAIYLCTGVLYLASGIYGLLVLTHYFQLSPSINLSLTPIVLCVIGGFIIISGLIGIVSAIKNNKFLVNSYCILLGVIFLAEVAGGVATILFIEKIQNSFETGFTNAIKEYNYKSELKTALNKAQIELHCCGATSYENWYNTEWANSTENCAGKAASTKGVAVPSTCCNSNWRETKAAASSPGVMSTCFCGNATDMVDVNTQGCVQVLFGTDGQTFYYLLASTFGCAILQLISMILSICIFRKHREIRSSRRY